MEGTYIPRMQDDNKDDDLIQWSRKFLTKEDIFVDIGAYTGNWSLDMAKYCKHVLAFEPHRITLGQFRTSIKENKVGNIQVEGVALTSEKKVSNIRVGAVALNSENNILPLYYNFDRPKWASLYFHGEDISEMVLCKTLDEYDTDSVSLIKITANGAEVSILKGARSFIERNHYPNILVEVSSITRDNVQILLKEMGYNAVNVNRYNNWLLCEDHPHYVEWVQTRDKITLNRLITTFEKTGDTNMTIMSWIEWHKLARHYRNEGKNYFAYVCAKAGLAEQCPKNKEHLLYEEISIVSYYLGKYIEGYDACDKVMFSFDADQSLVNRTLRNQRYYMTRLPAKKIVDISIHCPQDYSCSTPALMWEDKRLMCCLRSCNYYIDDRGYNCRTSDSIIYIRNFLFELNHDLSVKETVIPIEVVDDTGAAQYDSDVKGIEDIRPFGHGRFFATSRQTNILGIPRLVYGEYTMEGTITKILTPNLPGEITPVRNHEKNWLPFMLNDEVHFIYGYEPLRVFKYDVQTNTLHPVVDKHIGNGRNLASFRGSGGLVEYKDGWMGTVHQVCLSITATRREYYHRFIWFPRDFSDIKISPIFYFENTQTEFNLSLCLTKEGILVPYSVMDVCSKIAVVDYEVIDRWLQL
jgi:FkbM family methyltransferase